MSHWSQLPHERDDQGATLWQGLVAWVVLIALMFAAVGIIAAVAALTSS